MHVIGTAIHRIQLPSFMKASFRDLQIYLLALF